MRLFIAIGLPAEIKDVLAQAAKRIPKDMAEFSLVKPENMHLTLKFLGEVPEEKAEEIKTVLDRVSFSPFQATIAGVGVFPSIDHVNVVWVGLADGEETVKLQHQIDDSLQTLGFAKEKDYTPHLTICRVKQVKDRDRLREAITKMHVEQMTFSVDSFVLMQSSLTREGVVYGIVQEYKAAETLL